MLGVSRLTIYRLIHNGQLPSVRVGGQYRLPRRALAQRLAETRGGWPIEGRRAMSDRIVPGESHVRTTAKAAKHGQALYAEDDDLDPDERQRGFWRERDLGTGVVLVEWVSDPGGQSPKEEESTPASRFAGIRTRDWLAPDPPRRPKRDWLAPSKPRRDWLAVREEDRRWSWRLPDTPRRPRDWLAPEPAAPATAPLSFGSWAHPSPSSIGLPVVGRMVPYNEWTEVDSKREGNFLERFAPVSFTPARGGPRTHRQRSSPGTVWIVDQLPGEQVRESFPSASKRPQPRRRRGADDHGGRHLRVQPRHLPAVPGGDGASGGERCLSPGS
jgi:excisionase family DNA binding protein